MTNLAQTYHKRPIFHILKKVASCCVFTMMKFLKLGSIEDLGSMWVIFLHSAMVSNISVLHCNLNLGPRAHHTHLYYYSNHDYYATVRYVTFCLIIFQVPQVAAPTRPLPLLPSPPHPSACCCIQLVPAEGVFGSPAAAAPHLWQQFLHFYFHLMCMLGMAGVIV